MIEPPRPSSFRPSLPRLSCKSADAFALMQDYAADFAQTTATVRMGADTSVAGIYVAGYYPGWSARQFALIRSFAARRCRPFTLRDEITAARVKMRPAVALVPGLGDQAIAISYAQVNGPLPDGTYYPGDYMLLVRVGGYIVNVDAPDIPGQSQARQARQVASVLVRNIRKLN